MADDRASPPDHDEDLHRSSVGIAILRIWCGLWLLLSVQPKLPLTGWSAWTFPAELEQAVQEFAQYGALDIYQPALETVGRHPQFFSCLIVFAETMVGILLLLGLFTRVAATGAIFLGLNYLLATARIHRAYVGLNLWIIVTGVLMLLGRGGRHYALDKLFRGSSPRPTADA